MKMQRLIVIAAFTLLAATAILIGCTSQGVGFLIPVEEARARFAFVVNGNVDSCGPITLSAYTVNTSTGALTAVPGSPFATSVTDTCGNVFIDVDPQGRFLFLPAGESGSTVSVYSIDPSSGVPTAVSGSPFPAGGDGPFSVKTDPTGRFLYVANRTAGTVSAFTVGANGTLTAVGTPASTVGDPFFLIMDPQGRFLYATVETEGYVVEGYAINSTTGALTPIPGTPFSTASRPRSGTVDSTGRFLLVANRGSSQISVYSIDQTSGALTPAAGSPFTGSSKGPFHIVEVANGANRFMAVNNINGPNVSIYSFNGSTGNLTEVSGSPFAINSPQRPTFMAVDPSGGFGYLVDLNDTITGVTIDATGTPTQITGSPFTTGGVLDPFQIVVR